MGLSFTESIDRISESAEQDQTARMCRLILLYSLRKMNIWSRTVRDKLKGNFRPLKKIKKKKKKEKNAISTLYSY